MNTLCTGEGNLKFIQRRMIERVSAAHMTDVKRKAEIKKALKTDFG